MNDSTRHPEGEPWQWPEATWRRLVGRARASHAGFGYSDALKSKTGNWNYADLAQFIHNPKGYAPGTKMSFNGLPDPTDLANLLAFLRTQSDSPAPVPGK